MKRPSIPPVGFDDLSAYVDGELDNERRAAVDRLLSQDADMADRVARYRRHDDHLRQALAPLAQGGMTEELDALVNREAHGRPGMRFWIAVAASLLLIVAGASVWWFHDSRARARILADLVNQATVAHLSYLSKPPVAQGSAATAALADNLRRIAGNKSTVPSFEDLGYHWIGGRVLGTGGAPALLLAYRNDTGVVVSCYFAASTSRAETAYLSKQTAGMTIVYRLYEGVGYAVTGALPPPALMKFADRIYPADAD